MINRMRAISHREMFPELDTDDKDRFINFLMEDNTKIFVRAALDKANYELTAKDLQLCEIVLDDLIYRGVLQPITRQQYVDVILIAAMLRNCYKDEDHPVTSLFKPREEFNDIEILDEFKVTGGIPKQFFEQLYQLIEGQYGELTEVHFCKPTVGSIQQMFVDCIKMQEAIYKYDRVDDK